MTATDPRRRPEEPSWLARHTARTRSSLVIVDQVAIDRYLAGDTHTPLTKVEKREAIRQAFARGYGWREVSQLFPRTSGAEVQRAVHEALPMVDEPIAYELADELALGL